MQDKVDDILEHLEHTKQNLLDLSDDIWRTIDHRDNAEIEEGAAFQKEYNQAVAEFADAAGHVEELIQDYAESQTGDDSPETLEEQSEAERERIVEELDRKTAHSLDEDFRYKRPYGFAIDGRAARDLTTWTALHQRLAQELYDLEPDQFDQAVESEEFETSHGNRHYADNPDGLREPRRVADGVWVETHFSANDTSRRIADLLGFLGYEPEDVDIYLREDQDAASA